VRYGIGLAALILAILGSCAVAFAAHRPDALDIRVDFLTRRALLTEPATALVDPVRQLGAQRRAHWTAIGFVLTQLFEAGALLYLWSSGGAAALRDRLRRRASSEWMVRFLFGAALGLVARVAALLPSFYLYRVDHMLGLTTELTRYWLLYWILHTLLAMIIAGLIAAIVLSLVARTHQWYVYSIFGILAASVGWSYASQYVTSPGWSPVRAANGAMVRLRDQTLVGSTQAELKYSIAYQLGHEAQSDQLSIALIEGGIIVVFGAIAIFIADRVSFRRDDDSLSRLAIVGALLALVYLAAVPVRNAALRSYDFGADAYAVALTGDPAAAVRSLIRTADQRMVEVCPDQAALLFLYTAPGIGARVAAINRVPSGCP
jgi:Zn-dependent protease with chaperone function